MIVGTRYISVGWAEVKKSHKNNIIIIMFRAKISSRIHKSSFPYGWVLSSFLSFFFYKIFMYLFSERGEGREKERERNIHLFPLARPLLGTWPTTQACALTGT